MEDEINLRQYNNYLTTKEEFRNILNEFNYYKHEMVKEKIKLKMENKSNELKLRNFISNVNKKEEEISKIVI